MTSRLTVGIDTGGTFTDFASVNPDTGRIEVTKIPSTPHDPSDAIHELMAARGDHLGCVVHGTTVATNAVLQRKGARIALITTLGFRDTLEIGRTRRASPGLFNTKFVKQSPLVPRSMRFEVDERMLADGSVLRSIDEVQLSQTIAQLVLLKPEVVVVCLLHSYANSIHEKRVRDAVKSALPMCPVVISAEVVPELREFERLSTTVINGYLLPSVESYLHRLMGHVDRYEGGPLYVMGSNGGIMTASTAAAFPARIILSGPAGGIRGANLVAEKAGLRSILTCDMGGTSTDVSLVRDLQPTLVQDSMIGGFPLMAPQLDINTVGAGGGSIAWIDFDGSLHLGPQSAGALPGPACYGRGGEAVTITDANLHLGRLGPRSLLGGAMEIDRGLSLKVLRRLAEQANLADVDRLAQGVVQLAVTKMVGALRQISIERGHDPRDFTLLPFGGAGPLHGAEIAEELGITRILVPRYPGNLSAVGLLGSDIRYDIARTLLADLESIDIARIDSVFEEIEAQGIARLCDDGFSIANTRMERSVDMRFHGQASALTVPMQSDCESTKVLGASFRELYQKRYGFGRIDQHIEVTAARVAAIGIVRHNPSPPLRPIHFSLAEALKERRSVYLGGDWIPACPVYERDRLGGELKIRGPAVIEEFGSTTVVPSCWTVTVDEWGNLRMEN